MKMTSMQTEHLQSGLLNLNSSQGPEICWPSWHRTPAANEDSSLSEFSRKAFRRPFTGCVPNWLFRSSTNATSLTW